MVDLKKKFSEGDNKTMKVVELKKVEWRSRTIEKFIQKFRRATRGSRYKERLLVEKFKRGMNGVIRRKLIEVERPSRSTEQWYERATNLDQHWKESRKNGEKLRERREI